MVKCQLCGKEFQTITNTHLKLHNIDIEKYKKHFPDSILVPEDFRKLKSNIMMGKNKGNKRPDAQKRMNQNNPMKDKETTIKMGVSRSKGISEGKFNPVENFSHLPTPKEKKLGRWLKKNGISMEYVGDGKKNIDGFFPDFINEDLKIILELELNFTKRPRNELSNKEIAYQKAGYKTIWVTQYDLDYWESWIKPHFEGGLKKSKIKQIWKETHIHPVYNFEVSPNNTYIANRVVVHNCFANSFRASLYTAFFDNSKTVGIRQCNPDYYKRELDKIMANREKPPESLSHVNKAIAMGIPIRFGIRFEDFLYAELKRGVSLELLRYLSDLNYPVMINTKSDVVGRDEYVKALADNEGKAAVHITMISSNNKILKDLEPGAPSFEKRLEAGRALTEAGVRVVARIEPFLVFINDHPDDVQDYMDRVWQAGIRHITFDTYSYTAHDPGIRSTFISQGYDWDRLFLLGCDSQGLGSLLLGKFMEMFQERGFQCSTFDMGNMPINNQTVCCEVGDWFEGGFNYGCTVVAARYIRERGLTPTSWVDFETYVNAHGGFLTEALKADVKHLWNIEGNNAYSPNWSAGIEPCGRDEHGIIWNFKPESDFRQEILEGLI